MVVVTAAKTDRSSADEPRKEEREGGGRGGEEEDGHEMVKDGGLMVGWLSAYQLFHCFTVSQFEFGVTG